MEHRMGVSRIVLLALALLSALCLEGVPVSAAETGDLLLPGPGSLVRVDQKVLDRLVRTVLKMGPGRLVYQNRPRSFTLPERDSLSGEILVEWRDRNLVHMAMVVRRRNVIQEMFYFDVRPGSLPGVLPPQTGSQMLGGEIRTSLDEAGVQSGDTVRIQAVGNGFVITLAGIAQESGRSGDRVTVFNPMSGVRFQGRVIGPDRVRIRVGGDGHGME
ncbi:MAG: flagella basal body P-ring formation protein FlgA [Leptospirales bacterium]